MAIDRDGNGSWHTHGALKRVRGGIYYPGSEAGDGSNRSVRVTQSLCTSFGKEKCYITTAYFLL